MDENSNSLMDNVNHPAHYKSSSGLETIDVIEAFTEDLRGCEATHTGNVLKYICRWKHKNGLEDLKKAQWYLNRLIDHVEEQIEKERIEAVKHVHAYTQCMSTTISPNRDYHFDAYNHKEELK